MSETHLGADDFDVLFSGSCLATARVSPTGRFLQVNAAYAAFVGYSEAELLELTVSDITHPDDREESAQMVAALVAGEIAFIQMRKRYVHRQGHEVWGQLSSSVLRDPDGRPRHMVAQIQDVTDYVRASAALAVSEERYRSLVEQSPVALATVRADGVVEYANASTLRLFGAASLDELVGQSIVDRLPPESRDQELAAFQTDAESEVVPDDNELRLLRLDGTPVDVEVRSIPFRAGQSPGMLVQLTDNTERHARELEIARLNRLYAVLSRINRAVVRLPDRDELFGDVCRILADAGDYRLAWIGLRDPETDELRPVAGWSADAGRLEPAACQAADLHVRGEEAASASLPVTESGQVVGVLTVYADEVDTFVEQELDLLREITVDLSYALDNLARDARRRKAERELRASEERLTEAQHVGGIGDWAYDLVTGESFWSPEIFELFGRDPALGTPEPATDNALLFEAEGRERLMAALRGVAVSGESREGEVRAVRPDGVTVDLLARAVARRDPSGAVVGLYGTVQDITALKRAERLARQSEERLSFALDSANLGHWDKNFRTGDVSRSPQHDRCYGYDEPPADWNRAIMLGHIVEEDRERVAAALDAALDSDAGYDEVYRVRWPDGSVHWLWGHGRYWFDDNHVPYRAGGIVMDVDERIRTREATYRLAAIVDSARDAVIGLDLDGTVVSWNPAAERVYGYPAHEMIGRPIERLIPADHVAEEAGAFGRVAHGGIGEHYETVRRRRDGSQVEVALTISPITDAGGQIIGVSKVARDITASKQRERELVSLEEQLRQSQKMEAVGILAGGIAHDFNNLLTVILGYSDVALLRLPDDGSAQQSVVEIRRAAEMAADLTRQLLAFSRQQVLRPQDLDVEQVVRETSGLLQRLLGEDVALTFTVGEQVAHAFADRGQVEQILMNLAANARDAMPEYDGRLELELVDVTVGTDDAAAPAGVEPGEYVRLSVTDNGHGMDHATMGRVFEPFFTTKEFGSGTGLGLSTVFGIVQQSKGHILVESQPGAGATFRIYLPAFHTMSTEHS